MRGLTEKTLEFSEAVKTWESLSDEQRRLQGLRINDAKEIIDALEKKYYLLLAESRSRCGLQV
jgi:hypothetical protein